MTQPYGQQPGGYQQPGAGGLPQAPQPPAYQGGYGGMPQAPQEYSGGPVARPGVVLAAAVLAYVQAGITAITTILVFAQVGDMTGGAAAVQALIGVVQAAGVILLIMGGVQLMGGKGKGLMLAACVVELVICLFYIVAFAIVFGALDSAGFDVLGGAKALLVGIAIGFAVMPTISLVMSLNQQTTQFLQSRR